jgi:hypothetical protein
MRQASLPLLPIAISYLNSPSPVVKAASANYLRVLSRSIEIMRTHLQDMKVLEMGINIIHQGIKEMKDLERGDKKRRREWLGMVVGTCGMIANLVLAFTGMREVNEFG